jgi:hypothetical protein
MFQLSVGKRQDVRGIGANRVSVNQKGFSLRLSSHKRKYLRPPWGLFFWPVCLFVVMRRGSEGVSGW